MITLRYGGETYRLVDTIKREGTLARITEARKKARTEEAALPIAEFELSDGRTVLLVVGDAVPIAIEESPRATVLPPPPAAVVASGDGGIGAF